MKLNSTDVQNFKRDGFIRIDRLIDNETVEKLRVYYDQFMNGEIASSDENRKLGGAIPLLLHPRLYHDYFRHNPALDESMEVAAQLMDSSAVKFNFDMLIDKPPLTEKETPWHQDQAYAQKPFTPAGTPIENSGIQFWVALDDVDVETGCMQFIPGLHTRPLLEHYLVSGDPSTDSRLLATKQIDALKVVPLPLQAGGCTVHHYGTPHYTGPNRSATRKRRAYIFNYLPAACGI
jgi:ectoine hydroxylase-related dioxygenase (phytanoyl-CoA dioxygenase family)